VRFWLGLPGYETPTLTYFEEQIPSLMLPIPAIRNAPSSEIGYFHQESNIYKLVFHFISIFMLNVSDQDYILKQKLEVVVVASALDDM